MSVEDDVTNLLNGLIEKHGAAEVQEVVRHWFFDSLNERILADHAARKLESE